MSRAERTNSVLDASPRLTVAQAKRLAQDELWIGTEHWTRWLDDAARSHPELVESLSPPAQRVFGRLDRFDGVANVASVAALNHFFWRSAVWSTLDKNGQQLLIDVLAGHAQPTDALQKLAIESVERAVQQLQQALGSVDRPYGDYFRVSRDGQQSWSVGGGPPLSVQDYFQCGVLEKPPYVCS
jgi:xanthine/CO dehydrogenase XdhC/CoxF family maturation factor